MAQQAGARAQGGLLQDSSMQPGGTVPGSLCSTAGTVIFKGTWLGHGCEALGMVPFACRWLRPTLDVIGIWGGFQVSAAAYGVLSVPCQGQYDTSVCNLGHRTGCDVFPC